MIVVTLEGIEERVPDELGELVTLCPPKFQLVLTKTITAEAERARDEPDSWGMRFSS